MNNRILYLILCFSLIFVLATGCTTAAPTDTPPETPAETVEELPPVETPESTEEPVAEETPEPEVVPEEDASDDQVLLDFLSGQIKILTSEKFHPEDEPNYYDLPYGEYSFDELKAAVEELMYGETEVRYATIELGQSDHIGFALRFDHPDPSFTNWVGILNPTDQGLLLTDSYIDGYRVSSRLFTPGYLHIGGSSGAGAYVTSLIQYDEAGLGQTLFQENIYFSSWVSTVFYDLSDNGWDLANPYSDLLNQSELKVREYVAGEKVMLSVSDWSTDDQVRAGEEELIQHFVSLGAELVDEAEMDQLTSLEEYESDEVKWQHWPPLLMDIDTATPERLAQVESYDEFIADESEFQVKAILTPSTLLRDVQVLALQMNEPVEEEITFTAEELYYLSELTPDKPLVVGLEFLGTIPNRGIAFLDETGTKHAYAIIASGKDGSLLLGEINLK